jgi:hypothetical protein
VPLSREVAPSKQSCLLGKQVNKGSQHDSLFSKKKSWRPTGSRFLIYENVTGWPA